MGHRIRPLAAAVAVLFAGTGPLPAGAETNQLNDVLVQAGRLRPLPDASRVEPARQQQLRAASSDTASLLQDLPGVSLYGAGGLSSLPAIHGLADDRLRIKVDGMDLIASCPNHMNPPLSYLDPSQVGTLTVYAGIAPVSLGGDSIGGSIVAETRAPEFAAAGQGLLSKGELGSFYRSNNDARGANLSATLATENLSLSYSGAYSEANNYKAGKDFKDFEQSGRPGHTLERDEVGSTAYRSNTHTLGLAVRGDRQLFEAKLGYQDMPKQLYPNQRMDLLDNEQKRLSLRWLGGYNWGRLEARAYHEEVDHFMNFGPDKQFQYGTAPGMPMRSEGKTSGAGLTASIDLSAQDLLRVGAEFQHYRLDDWWPPSGTGGMAPDEFLNINDGRRDRAALFGEWEKQLGAQWTTLLGIRYERVSSDADEVHGYSSTGMMGARQVRDAANFNLADRSRTDHNWDLTALARYAASANLDLEAGLARKVRSPNLYERYTWSTSNMMAIMNNTVGDGNGYIGNVELEPEKAHTLSATVDWHATDRRWEFKATPFYTHVDDYIDAIQWDGATNAPRSVPQTETFTVLRYSNQEARLYGIDLSGKLPLGATGLGRFALKGLLNYTNGKNRDTDDELYNIMPLNAKLILTHQIGGWDNALEFIGAKGKDKVADARNEVPTSGYGLVNLRASHSWNRFRIDFGVENLFDRYYALPTGGAYTGQGTTMGINSIPWGIPVPGMGRSLYAGLNLKF